MGKGMTFVDVGAHFGYFSILAAACGGSGCRVVAFEPTPSTYAVLKENTSSSDSILALNMGLYSSEGRLPFKDFGIGHGAFNTLYRGTKPVTELFATKAREIVVPVTTLDAYCKASACKPDVIKLDAETAEYEILQGARETIGKYHPDISIEAGGGAGDVGSSRQAVHYLLSVGYQQYIWEGGRLVRVRATSDDFSSVANLFFIHPSRQIATGA
jgi:FkbM family methyltransferase